MNTTNRTLVILAITGVAMAGMVVVSDSARAAWVAYHDLGALGTGQSSGNVTNQGSAGATIDLVNYAGGADTGVDFSIAGANGTGASDSSAPASARKA